MKVKIAYTIDLDDIPQKVQDFLKESEELLYSKEVKESFKKATTAFCEGNLQTGLELMELIRSRLIEADIKMEDCTSVLVDYQKTISQMNYEKYNDEEETSNDEG